MTDGRDPLEQIWQQQEVSVPSGKVLQAKWRKEKRKQVWYIGLDFMALCIAPVLLYIMRHKMHWFEIVWFIFIVLVTVVYTGYIVWLRRLAFVNQDAATTDYLDLLTNQYKQNIKIALATKYSTFALPPLFMVMFVGAYYLEIFEPERLLRKFLVACGMFVITLTPIWFWADKRVKRFQQELAQLSSSIPLV